MKNDNAKRRDDIIKFVFTFIDVNSIVPWAPYISKNILNVSGIDYNRTNNNVKLYNLLYLLMRLQ